MKESDEIRAMELKKEQQEDEKEYYQSLIDEQCSDNLSCCGDEIDPDKIDRICPTCGEHC